MTRSLLHRHVQGEDCQEQGVVPSSEEERAECQCAEERRSEVQSGGIEEMAETEHTGGDGASSRRHGDSGVGHRTVVSEPIDITDYHPLPEGDGTASQESACEEEEMVRAVLVAPSWICKPLRYCLLFAVALAVCFIVTQTASFLADVRHLSLTEKVLLSVPLGVFGIIILVLIVKVLSLVIRLRVSPQIRIKGLQELSERNALRGACLKGSREAVEKLRALLEASPYEDRKAYLSLGFSPEELESLCKHKQRLLQQAARPESTSVDWIHDFRKNIQVPLEKKAEQCINRHSINTAIMTGISPFSLMDRLIVFAGCLSMLKDLLVLYSLKPSWDKSMILMGQVIINTYVAGVLEDVSEAGIEGVSKLVGGVVKGIPEFGLRFGGKAVEMTAQGYMIHRLGKAAMKVLRPLSVQEEESLLPKVLKSLWMQKHHDANSR